MSYSTYTTEALVCGSKDSLTSDRSFLLFTEDVGMLWAAARSVREERSKQRYALQDFSLVRVSLVKGKSGWRIGSVEAVGNPFMEARDRRERAHVKNTVSLLRRYIHGEQAVAHVFADVKEALDPLSVGERYDAAGLVFAARLLYELGYVSTTQHTKAVFEAATLAAALTVYKPTMEAELEQLVERAHHLSHL